MEQDEKKAVDTSAEEASSKQRVAKRTTKAQAKKKPGKGQEKAAQAARRPYPRTTRPYPRVTLEQALRIPLALKEKNGGNPWPPSDVAAAVGLSHENTDFFYMAAASRDFGLKIGRAACR